MIITFARLQRLSGLQRPTAIKQWLEKRAIAYIEDAIGQPFTTLEAINDRLRYGHNRPRKGGSTLARDYSSTSYEEDLQFHEKHERWSAAPNRYGISFDESGRSIDHRIKKQAIKKGRGRRAGHIA